AWCAGWTLIAPSRRPTTILSSNRWRRGGCESLNRWIWPKTSAAGATGSPTGWRTRSAVWASAATSSASCNAN
ncbi:hypothetical protein ACFFX0_33430, partial [Citricoccus parietis]